MTSLDAAALDLIFLKARSRNGWQAKPIPDGLLREIYDIARMGPTTMNTQPQRIVFVTSEAGKARLEPALSEGNRTKTMSAPAVAIFAWDSQFYELLPKVFPHNPTAKDGFMKPGREAANHETAFRNASLQAAYFMIAARAKGLDCGPMSGFSNAKVDAEFFADGRYKSNFICALGYGSDERLFGRLPRLSFDEACQVV